MKNISMRYIYLQVLPLIGVIMGHLVLGCLFSINQNVWNRPVYEQTVLWYQVIHNRNSIQTAFVLPTVL